MKRRGFTLIELLVVIGIIAILGALGFALAPSAIQHAQCAGCASRMHGLSLAFVQYAGDHDGQLPSRTVGSSDKWPVLLLPYVSDPKNYVDPGDPVASAVASQDLASNNGNASSFFFNGFNDLGAYTNPSVTVTLANLTGSNLALLGQKVHGSDQYYMDFVEGNEYDVLNKTAYFGGANYGFADGSVRYISLANYNNQMWLINQNYQIPPQQQ
jgi:prepilin-type N-terminal cleavage/methylation domain-containing protein/prepilin-type processing-associated H-X9-DG protein